MKTIKVPAQIIIDLAIKNEFDNLKFVNELSNYITIINAREENLK